MSSKIGKGSTFEGANRLYKKAFFKGHLGYGSYIGHNCEIVANIGRFTSIAPYVKSNRGIHPMTYPYATTSPAFFSLQKQCGMTFATKQTFNELLEKPIIGNDCWIGEDVFICGGLKVGDGAVILAGAVVANDVPPYAVVGGVPAKVIKYRYDEAVISKLREIAWWNQSVSWLTIHWQLLCNVDMLIDYYNSHKEEFNNNDKKQCTTSFHSFESILI